MKIKLKKADILQKALHLSGIVSSKNTLPILDNILIRIEDKYMWLSATDLETTMETFVPIENTSGKNIETCIPAKLFRDATTKLQDDSFELAFDKDICTLTYDKGEYKFPISPANDYPQKPTFSSEYSFLITDNELKNIFSRCSKFIGVDELRPIMSGVLFDASEAGVTFVATDAFKLITYKSSIVSEVTQSAVIPKKAVIAIERIMESKDKEAELLFNDKYGVLNYEDISVMFRLIEGKYPSYKSVIPKDNNIISTASSSVLSSIMLRAKDFSEASLSTITMDFSENNRLTISSMDLDLNKSFREEMLCECNDILSISFKAGHILICLTALGEDIEMRFSDPTKAVLLYEKDNDNIMCLCMPYR